MIFKKLFSGDSVATSGGKCFKKLTTEEPNEWIGTWVLNEKIDVTNTSSNGKTDNLNSGDVTMYYFNSDTEPRSISSVTLVGGSKNLNITFSLNYYAQYYHSSKSYSPSNSGSYIFYREEGVTNTYVSKDSVVGLRLRTIYVNADLSYTTWFAEWLKANATKQ